METNKILRREILGIVDNQIRDERTLETKQIFERLVKSGYSKTDAKKLVG